MDLELHRNFTIEKILWDSVALERLELATNVAQRADVAAVVLQEGLANVCLITEHMTVVRQRIELPIPRKRRGDPAQHDKGLNKFFEQILQAILRHVNFDVVKCLIIASPGFVKV